MNTTQTFITMIMQDGKTATGIVVPKEVVELFKVGKKPPVKVTVNIYTVVR